MLQCVHEENCCRRFQSPMSRFDEDVRATRRPLLITKRGKPVAKLVPAEDDVDDFIGRLKGVFRVVGDN
jgi:hypothetical protein